MFVVRLPAPTAEVEKPQPARAPGPLSAAVQVDQAFVVDDNIDVAESLSWLLERLAREIKMVHSGSAAIEVVEPRRPDVILCELGMREMDGYETCRRLRQFLGLDKTIIAAVSGYAGKEERRKSQEAAFDLHLVKLIGRATLEKFLKGASGA